MTDRVVTDSYIISQLELDEMWDNYVAAMDAAEKCARSKARDGVVFFVAIARITLDHYFGYIDEIVDYVEEEMDEQS